MSQPLKVDSVMTQMRRYFLLFCLCPIAVAHADAIDDFKAQMKRDNRILDQFNSDMEAGSREGCATSLSHDLSSCFLKRLAQMTITTSAQIPNFGRAGIEAAGFDKAHGYDASTSSLMMIGNELSVLEKIDVNKFDVSTRKPTTSADYIALVVLKKSEAEHLKSSFRKMLDPLDSLLSKIEDDDQTKKHALNLWQLKTARIERQRLNKLKESGGAHFAANAIVIEPSALGAIMLQNVCSPQLLQSCKPLTPVSCKGAVERARASCVKNQSSLADLENKEKLEALISTLARCFKTEVSQEFQILNPDCK